MQAKIAVVGSLNMDLVVQLIRWPERGETVLGRSYRHVPGGKGANQAVASARQGAEVYMIGCVGQDEFGATLLQSLRVAGVQVDGVRTASNHTGVALVTVEPDGENRIVVIAGANRAVSVAHVEDEAAALAEADWLLLQLEIPMETVIAAAQGAHARGTRVLLNPSPAPAPGLPDELLAAVAVLVPNEREALALTGTLSAEEAAAQLRARGVGTVVITRGKQGVLLADAAGIRAVPPFQVEVVDTTAAGDAFVGALAAALAAGQTLDEAARYAAAAGALAVTRPGAQPSLPTLEAVEALVAAAEGQAPAGYPEELVIPFTSHTGEALIARPILPADAPGLLRLWETLSPESIYRRFFMQRKELGLNEARALASVDYGANLALVATPADDPAQLLGVARYAPAQEREGAVEMAIVIADAFQHHGIGRQLFALLVTAAQTRGHRWMLVETHSDNQPMIDLAARAALPTETEHDGALTRLWLKLGTDSAEERRA